MGIGHMVLVAPSTTATNMVLSTRHGQNSPSITIMALPCSGMHWVNWNANGARRRSLT